MLAQRGQRIRIDSNRLFVTIGWKSNKEFFDVDSEVTYDLGERINYINSLSQDQAIQYLGNIEVVNEDMEQETFDVSFEKINNDVKKLTITMKIYEAQKRKQNFTDVETTFICISDYKSKEELIRFEFQGNGDKIYIAEIYKYQGDWKFRAIGQ